MVAQGNRLSFVACWALSSLVFFALMATWSFATPLGAVSDEPTHIVKAAAVARGEFLGQPAKVGPLTGVGHEGRAVMTVVVPATFAKDSNLATCYRHHPKRNATCAPPMSTSSHLEVTTTYVGRYPPLYYMVVGLPSRFLQAGSAVRFMRVLSSLASGVLLGLALAAASRWSRSRFLALAVALAATPMVIFLGSVVNPSGLEISASIAAWTTGLVLVEDRTSAPNTSVIVAFTASSCTLMLIRGLSPLWFLLIVVTLVALEPRRCWRLIQQPVARIAALVMVVVGALATTYVVAFGATAITPSGIPLSPHATATTVANLYESHITGYVTQIVGVFGWLDTPAPFLVVLLIGAAIAGLLWFSLATSRRRHVVVLVGLLIAAIVIPIAIDIRNALQIHNDVWQSRYALPLYLGVPLVAGAIGGQKKSFSEVHYRRLIIVGASVIAVCQFVCFFSALHRYTVGIMGGLNPLVRVVGSWAPPLPAVVLLVVAVLVSAVYGWWIVRLDRVARTGRSQPSPGADAEVPAPPEPQPIGSTPVPGFSSG